MLTKSQINKLSYDIIGAAIEVHKQLGPGLLESVYQQCLIYELESNGIEVLSQVKVPLDYKGLRLAQSLRLDLIVEDVIIIELKTVEIIQPVHKAQLLSYMQLARKPKGLLMNFYTENLSKNVIPLVNNHFRDLPE